MTGFILPPWSYSMLSMFDNCPKQAFHRYVLKEKPPETEEMRKGNEFDKAVEARLLKGTPLPAEWQQHEPYAKSLADVPDAVLYSQLKMGLDREFKPAKFFSNNVWGCGVIDVALIKRRNGHEGNKAIITDWKTGKNSEGKSYSDNGLQLKIFAAMLFKWFPGVDTVTAFNLWLKTREIGKPWVFARADEAMLWREILPKVMKVEKAFAGMAWPAQPGPLCGWCSVKTCVHNKS